MAFTVISNIRNYQVHFTETANFLSRFDEITHRIYIVDKNVWDLYENSVLRGLDQSNTVVLLIDEDRKCLETVTELYDHLIERSAKRNLTMISIGGGVLQDITGFAASTLYRGINWIFVPTTLLAQADSCIGSKTSLNYKGFKNLIGSFYPPSEVVIYAPFLQTQKDLDFFSGLGEVIKLHLMGGEAKVSELGELMPRIVNRELPALLRSVQNSLQTKQSFIVDDEFDTGRRNLLNFGHCFGHALESASRYEIPHGQAVILGMLLANMIACYRQMLSESQNDFLTEHVLLPALIVKPRLEHLRHETIVEAMKMDKKRTGEGLVLIMMTDDYELIRIDDLTFQEVVHAISQLSELLS